MGHKFRPRARILQLLGDQLIGTPQLAIFELVKNAYDADADSVEVTIEEPEDADKAIISVVDYDGEGMDYNTVVNVWMEPGDDHKLKARRSGVRTKKHKRLPLGEKGVGRFAVHKLGKVIKLITKSESSNEVELIIDFDDFSKVKYIEDAEIEVWENPSPKHFNNGLTGTKIIISKLHKPFIKREIVELYRNLQSIKSPFKFDYFSEENTVSSPKKAYIDSFDITLNLPDHKEWIQSQPDINNVINQALFKFYFRIKDGKWSYAYEYTPSIQLEKATGLEKKLICHEDENFTYSTIKDALPNYRDLEIFSHLGEIQGELYVFDLDSTVAKYYKDSPSIRVFLRNNKGIRIYRDGIRVYNYGEVSDDWLGLDAKRIQNPSQRLSRDLTVGAIKLDLAQTPELIEKTNREGFVENDAYLMLKLVITEAVGKFESLRFIDKSKLRELLKTKTKSSIVEIDNPINEIRKLAEKNNLTATFEPLVYKLEKSYNEMRDIVLTAGAAGLNVSMAFHEIYHGLELTKKILSKDGDINLAVAQIERFILLMDTYATFLKQEPSKEITLKKIIQNAVNISSTRFIIHQVVESAPILTNEEQNYIVKAPMNNIVGSIYNIIDNAIYWMDVKYGIEKREKGIKSLYIGVSTEFEKGPAIIIADNGPGWRDVDPTEITKPFITTKPYGMGIGLFFAKTAMETCGGELVILNPDEVDNLPPQATGAVVALVFDGGTKCTD